MSADWFCKIGEKKYGPLNGQQLKTIVAKGQLKPDHLVRRGSEGPWVPAGRIKGLFPHDASGNGASLGKKPPAATAKPLARAAKAGSLPTADAAPMPPSDVPQDLLLGAHKHHVELNVDSLNIEATPMKISHRKVKTGMQGLKQEERKRVTVLLLCFIGAGTTIGAAVIGWQLLKSDPTVAKVEDLAKPSAAPTVAADSNKSAKDSAKNITVSNNTASAAEKKDKEPADGNWPRIMSDVKSLGNVDVLALKPTRGPPPEGTKVKDKEVLIVPVRLSLKKGAKNPVKLTGWMDDSLQGKVALKDDQGKSYLLLTQVPEKGWDGSRHYRRLAHRESCFRGPHRQEPEVPAAVLAIRRLSGQRPDGLLRNQPRLYPRPCRQGGSSRQVRR